jgi:hypothetical protein
VYHWGEWEYIRGNLGIEEEEEKRVSDCLLVHAV